MKRAFFSLTLLLLPFFIFAETSSNVTAVNEYMLKGTLNFLADIQTTNDDDSINVVIEIPKGTTAKWEVNTVESSTLTWEFKEGKPRTVDYR